MAGKNYVIRNEFAKVLPTCQLLVASDIAIEAGLEFVKVYFARCNLACYSPKFSSIQ